MNNSILQTENLTKSYPLNGVEVQALRGVNVSIESGEFVAIVGPSGCGKSTLLSIAGGLMKPSSGHILLNGQDLTQLPEQESARLRRDHIGFVFQSFDLLADLTAAENVEFPMVLANRPESERRSWVQELLKRVGLADKADHLPDELSGGQKQRVAIARSLANRPNIILADEPTGIWTASLPLKSWISCPASTATMRSLWSWSPMPRTTQPAPIAESRCVMDRSKSKQEQL